MRAQQIVEITAEMSPFTRISFIKFCVYRRDIIEFHQTLSIPVADENSYGVDALKFARG